jgi:hypothetical protein
MAASHRWDGLTPEMRLLSRTDRGGLPGGCWLWQGSKNKQGYGQMWLAGRHMGAHRAAYILFVGPIPEGLFIDHLCGVPACVNPRHLEPVTNRENLLRGPGPAGRHARQTHCKRGHEFTLANTRISKRGERICRACRAAGERERRHYIHTTEEDVLAAVSLLEDEAYLPAAEGVVEPK